MGETYSSFLFAHFNNYRQDQIVRSTCRNLHCWNPGGLRLYLQPGLPAACPAANRGISLCPLPVGPPRCQHITANNDPVKHLLMSAGRRQEALTQKNKKKVHNTNKQPSCLCSLHFLCNQSTSSLSPSVALCSCSYLPLVSTTKHFLAKYSRKISWLVAALWKCHSLGHK